MAYILTSGPVLLLHVVVTMTITYTAYYDQPGKVANPASRQLNRGKIKYFPVPVYA